MIRTPASSILESALAYRARGLCVIPIARGGKKAAIKWKKFQTRGPTEKELQAWFERGRYTSLAVVMGDASGGLACRDFDTMESYERWAAAHQDLASVLATVATKRGRHVYFLTGQLGFHEFADGEYRADSKHYCVLPPSRHPDGPVYTWLIPLPDGPLPFVDDVRAAGFLDGFTTATESTEDNGGSPRITDAIGSGVGGEDKDTPKQSIGVWPNQVLSSPAPTTHSVVSALSVTTDEERAIIESLPRQTGKRHRQVFELARALKAIPWLADAEARALEPHVRRWHRLGVEQGVIATKAFEETWIDFLRAWPKVKFPKGLEPILAIVERARRNIPREAQKYEQPALRLLVSICRELQQAVGDADFYLATRTAGGVLGVDHVQAWRWLFLLQQEQIIRETQKGTTQRASRFRYIGGRDSS
jgi:hypothetical protein